MGGPAQPENRRGADRDGGHAAFRMTAFGEYADDDTASTTKQRDYKDATDLVVASTLTNRAGGRAGRSQEDDRNVVVTPTLRAGNFRSNSNGGTEAQMVVVANALRGSDGHDSEDGTGRQPALVIRTSQAGANGDGIAHDEAHTLDSAQSQAVVFRKSKRAASSADDESWVPDDAANTLNGFDEGDVRTTTAVVLKMREGKEGGGKGPLISNDQSLALATSGSEQTLFVPTDVRRLTTSEYAVLQGFPRWWACLEADNNGLMPDGTPYSIWTCRCPDGPQYAAYGNAVSVPVASWVGRRMSAEHAKAIAA